MRQRFSHKLGLYLLEVFVRDTPSLAILFRKIFESITL